MVTRAIASAQTQIEQQNFEIRKNVLKYDEVLNRQRLVVYAERRKVLEGADLEDQVRLMMDDTVAAYVDAATAEGYSEEWDLDKLWTALKTLYPVSLTVEEIEDAAGGRDKLNRDILVEELQRRRPRELRRPRGRARRPDRPRARAPRRPVGPGPQVARAPVRDGLPPGGHRPAGHGAARPAGGVPARGLRHVPGHDGGHQGGVGRLPVPPQGRGRAGRPGAGHHAAVGGHDRHRRPVDPGVRAARRTRSRPASRASCAPRAWRRRGVPRTWSTARRRSTAPAASRSTASPTRSTAAAAPTAAPPTPTAATPRPATTPRARAARAASARSAEPGRPASAHGQGTELNG